MYLTRTAGIETIRIAPIDGVIDIIMYLTRTAGIETKHNPASHTNLPMYLTRTAGIETPGILALKQIPLTECILPALRELKLSSVSDSLPALKQCILPALRELKHRRTYHQYQKDYRMYLTRTAGIETRLTDMSDAWHRMYLTRTAGIETLERYPRGVAALQCILPALRELKLHLHPPFPARCKCILPALRELKLPPAGHGGLLPPNVSYPHCGN